MPQDEMAKKIKLLRSQLGLTLEEVGDYVGVGKSTVRKWETGAISNMRRDKIAKLSEALHTTPAYLMGWEDSESESDKKRAELLALFNSLPEGKQDEAIRILKAILGE